jgi:hypothetical protein
MQDTVLKQVAEERRRQVEDLGWSPEGDDKLTTGQLVRMGAGYALHSTLYASAGAGAPQPGSAPGFWPHDYAAFKPEDQRSDLIRAAALIVAEIERLDRAEAAAEKA